MNRRMGYRLQVVEVSWPEQVVQEGELPVGPPDEVEAIAQDAAFLLPPHIQPGRYDLFVSVGTHTGTPTLALPYGDDDGHRRYRLGTVTITRREGDFGVEAGEGSFVDGTFTLPVTWTVRRPSPDGVVPFVHLEQGPTFVGSIGFEGVGKDAFKDPGVVRGTATLGVRPEYSGQTYSLKVGLWQPGNTACLPLNGRLLPDAVPPTRRVTLGELTVAEDGRSVKFVKP